MNTRWKALPVLGLICSLFAPDLKAQNDSSRDESLQAGFAKFPRLQPFTNSSGDLDFQPLELNAPVVLDGKEYFGFKFTVPARPNGEDLVWSFLPPPGQFHWYILREKGSMAGFENFSSRSRGDYFGTNLLYPPNGTQLYLQRLSGTRLKDGEDYLIWLNFDGARPAKMSVDFTFAPPESSNESEINIMEKQLGFFRRTSPPIVNPTNGHTYMLIRHATWLQSETRAVSLGGHLATVRNQAEEDWLLNTFGTVGGSQRLLWIGLHAGPGDSHFSWSSGESVAYSRWVPGKPDESRRDEQYVAIMNPASKQAGKWNLWGPKAFDAAGLPISGVVEIIPSESQIASSAKSIAPANHGQLIVEITPSLVVTNDDPVIALRWVGSLTDHVLEQTTNLAEPFEMFGYSQTTNAAAGFISATIQNPVPRLFLRLRQP